MELEGATVVVTGGTGFLGTSVCRELQHFGARAVPVGRSRCDLRRRAEIDALFAETRPDAVVHLAAVVGGIGANAASPGRFFYENALMGIEVLDAARVSGIGKVVVSGTVCSYPKVVPVPFHEDDLWAGYPEETNAPYGLAKRMLIVQADAYRKEYGCNFVTLLPVNLYGPGDNFEPESSHVLPALIRRFVEAEEQGASEVIVWGDGSASREFLFVDDCATAFCLALRDYDDPSPLNLGTGVETTISELVDQVREVTRYSGRVVWDASRPNGQPRRSLSTERAVQHLGWKATTPLEEGIALTFEWWMRNRA